MSLCVNKLFHFTWLFCSRSSLGAIHNKPLLRNAMTTTGNCGWHLKLAAETLKRELCGGAKLYFLSRIVFSTGTAGILGHTKEKKAQTVKSKTYFSNAGFPTSPEEASTKASLAIKQWTPNLYTDCTAESTMNVSGLRKLLPYATTRVMPGNSVQAHHGLKHLSGGHQWVVALVRKDWN